MIKKGDLVQCRWTSNVKARKYFGAIRTVAGEYRDEDRLYFRLEPPTRDGLRDIVWHPNHLRRIDPPSSGELTGVPLRLKEPV